MAFTPDIKIKLQFDVTAVQAALATLAADIAALIPDAPVTPPVPVLPVVTNLSANASVRGKISISWTNPTPAPFTVNVTRDGVEADGHSSPNWAQDLPPSQTTYTFGNLADATKYTIKVTPKDGAPTSVVVTTAPAPAPGTGTTPPTGGGTVTPPTTGKTRPFSLGFWGGDPADPNLVAQFESKFGQKVQMLTDFGSRDTVDHLEHPDYILDPATAMGKTVCITFQGDLSDGPNGGESFRTKDRPTVTAQAVEFGKNAIAHGQSAAAVRQRSEADNQSSNDEAVNPNDPNDIAKYVSFVQAIYTGLGSVPGQKFTRVAGIAPDPGDPAPKLNVMKAVAPYCDAFELDIYNTAVPWGSNWTNETEQWSRRWLGYNGGHGYKEYLDYALSIGKPVCFPEVGPGAEFDNGGAQQAPIDANATFYAQFLNALLTHGVTVLFVNFWEAPGAGILVNTPQARPASAAALKSSFGALPGAPWPR